MWIKPRPFNALLFGAANQYEGLLENGEFELLHYIGHFPRVKYLIIYDHRLVVGVCQNMEEISLEWTYLLTSEFMNLKENWLRPVNPEDKAIRKARKAWVTQHFETLSHQQHQEKKDTIKQHKKPGAASSSSSSVHPILQQNSSASPVSSPRLSTSTFTPSDLDLSEDEGDTEDDEEDGVVKKQKWPSTTTTQQKLGHRRTRSASSPKSPSLLATSAPEPTITTTTPPPPPPILSKSPITSLVQQQTTTSSMPTLPSQSKRLSLTLTSTSPPTATTAANKQPMTTVRRVAYRLRDEANDAVAIAHEIKTAMMVSWLYDKCIKPVNEVFTEETLTGKQRQLLAMIIAHSAVFVLGTVMHVCGFGVWLILMAVLHYYTTKLLFQYKDVIVWVLKREAVRLPKLGRKTLFEAFHKQQKQPTPSSSLRSRDRSEDQGHFSDPEISNKSDM